ncbi:fibronectin type III domain-containing protein [Acidaminococcus sp.]|uniref:fibronectin type III domain-containing protein n=1 Tax=Acidaminococcus sp. TaxID=1872103 RepID=UPI003AB4C3EA
MKRRKYALTAVVLLLAALAACFQLPQLAEPRFQIANRIRSLLVRYDLTNRADAYEIRQIMTQDPSTSRTLMWQSQDEDNGALAEIREKGAPVSQVVPAQSSVLTDNGVTRHLHTAAVTGLTPGTSYEYRVGNDRKRSSWMPLETPAGNTFSALIFPDSQSADYSGWKTLAQKAYKDHPDVSFFVNMGDLVDNGEHAYQWDAWFDALQGVIERIPVAPILGNHETYTLDWKVRRPLAYLQLFQLPAGDSHYAGEFYSFDIGEVHFVVLNTQDSELKEWEPNLFKDEAEWLRRDLTGTKKKWKVILMHRDVLQYGFASRPTPREEGFSDTGRFFMPIFDEFQVDAVLTAHLHTFRDRGHIKGFRRDGTGPLYLLTGVAGDVQYRGLWKRHALDEMVAPQPEDRNYLLLQASKEALEFICYDKNGQKMHAVSITK